MATIQFDIAAKEKPISFDINSGKSVGFCIGGTRFVLTAPPEVDMRVENDMIQYRSNDREWEDIIGLEELRGKGGVKKCIQCVIPASDWASDEDTEYPWFYNVEDVDIEDDDIPQVVIAAESLHTALEAGVCESAVGREGCVQIRSAAAPKEELSVSVYLLTFGTGEGGMGYELPIASADVLGGIKTSESIVVDETGRASAVIPDADFASEKTVEQALAEIFGTPENNKEQ